MQTGLKGRDFINTQDWSLEELETALELATRLKLDSSLDVEMSYLRNKVLAMIFFDNSTRTRVSFEAGMTHLGGHAIFLAPEKMQIAHGEEARDTGTIIGRYADGIAIRHCAYGVGNDYLNRIADASRSPVINMQCDRYHPCQIMADYMTIREKFGRDTRGLKIGIAWTSAPNYVRPMSVPQSLIQLMPRFGLEVTLAHPPEFGLMPDIMKQAQHNAGAAGVGFNVSNSFADAFEDADIVIPKSWGPLSHTQDEQEGLQLIEKYPDWVCDEKMMELTKPDSIYMHPLPADRRREVTDGVIDGPHSVVYDEAENRQHIQNAILALTL